MHMNDSASPRPATVKLWTRRFTVAVFATIGVCLVTNMYNLGMTYYADLLQGNIAYAGVSAGVFSFASLVARPLAGRLSNRFDRGMLSVVSTVLVGVLSYLHGFTETIGQLAVIRALHGLAFAVFSTAMMAEVNATLPRERLSEGLGFYSVSSALVPAVGPSLFLAIIDEGDISSFDEMFALSTVICMVVAAVTAVGLPISLSKRARRRKEAERGAAASSESVNSVQKRADLPKTFLGFEPATLLPAAILCLFTFVYAPVNFFLPEYAFYADIGDVGLFYLFFAIASLVCRFTVGKYADKNGPDGFLVVGMLLCAVSYAAIPFCPTFEALCAVAIPLGAGMGIVAPLLNYYIVCRCSIERPGSASAAYYAAYDIGYTVGAFLTGIVISTLGYTVLYVASGALALAGVVAFKLLLAGKGGVSAKA